MQGLWKAGKPDGPGRYKWRNKNDYDGEWRAGRMHGQGTLRWASGERYDGEWIEGEEHGLGVFTWRDGTTYDGFWQSGKKHGIGVGHAQLLGQPTIEPCSGRRVQSEMCCWPSILACCSGRTLARV